MADTELALIEVPTGQAALVTSCSFDGCDVVVLCRGLCSKHYHRQLRHGSAAWEPTKFSKMARVYSFLLVAETDDCLLWPFNKNNMGYAIMKLKDGKTNLIHRRICEDVHGHPPSASHHAAHSCGRGHRGCVNKRHVRWATPSENCADQIKHGTKTAGDQHGGAKLSRAQVEEIRKIGRSCTLDKIAAQFCTSRSNIWLILQGKRWGN